jgi:D-glycero-alpha-D-manno-heptose-7-phosphate kinase
MIITRTPLRVSFVGGGTDLREYYKKQTGTVLSTGINKYVYVIVKRQIGIVEHKYRINWSNIEFKNDIDEIEHPVVREVLRMFKIDFPVEITTIADIPAGTGLGSSSSFCVGLIHAVTTMIGLKKTKYELATLAAEVEVDILKRSMGKQDHFPAAYGNLNIINFLGDESVEIEPILCKKEKLIQLQNNLMLFYTFQTRDASKVLESQIEETKNKFDILTEMKNLAVPLSKCLGEDGSLDEFGKLLHQNWVLKKSLTNHISNNEIEKYYQLGLDSGAVGGKLLGAGGGGFLLFYVRPEEKKSLINSLSDLYPLSIEFDTSGSRLTYYDRSDEN